MRVKIQYSVELDEVPEVISELIDDESGCLSFCDHSIREVCDSLKQEQPNIKFALSKIDTVRQHLASFDNRLLEMSELLQGYDAAINPPPQPVMAPPPAPQPDQPVQQDIPRNPKIDPETGVYDWQRPYEVPKESEK